MREVERLKGFLASAGYDHDTGEGLAQGSGDDYETGEGLAPAPAQESRDQETTMTQERVDAHPKKVWLADRVVVHFECSICKGVQSAVIYYPKGDNNTAIRYSLLSLSLSLSFVPSTNITLLSLSLSFCPQKVRQAQVCGAEMAQPECERRATHIDLRASELWHDRHVHVLLM